MVSVEIIYIPTGSLPIQRKCVLPEGATVEDALCQSEMVLHYPEITHFAIGIFSKRVTLTTVLRSGDRIEIYRPLLIDPKEKRRQRAKDKP